MMSSSFSKVVKERVKEVYKNSKHISSCKVYFSFDVGSYSVCFHTEHGSAEFDIPNKYTSGLSLQFMQDFTRALIINAEKDRRARPTIHLKALYGES